MKRRTFMTVFALALLFAGCQKGDLHHGLSEVEADEIMNLLHLNGIQAEKVKEVSGQEVSWKVAVKRSEVHEARRILVANNFPRKKELGLSGVYKDKGLIPTPDEQRARFLLALKGEIINSIEKIPGVVDADIVLNIPPENEFSDLAAEERRPTASVVVRTRTSEEMTDQITEGKIQQFVANTVPLLHPNDVTVIIARFTDQKGGGGSLFPTPSSPSSDLAPDIPSSYVRLLGMKIDRESVGRLKILFIGLLLLLVLVSAALLFLIIRLNRMRVRLQSGTPVDAVPVEGRERPMLEGGASPPGSEGTF